ncbi:MAG TPA: ribulose-phosphate 3-epimerase [Flavobacteriales bacterium]|nr:ribulose-phosphate 3-epimerase [Flavobacteriales bacterium]
MSKHLIAPSILASDFSRLKEEIEMVNSSQADWFHLDVMDGVFVPNISFGIPVIASMKKHAKKPFDVHLMIVQPERYIDDFKNCGADILTVHYEASTHLHRTLDAIKKAGMKAGVAINPHTPISALEDIMPYMDLLCIMSVNPGFGGQKFIESTYNKTRQARAMANSVNPKLHIEIDGGVTVQNYKQLIECGADVLVAGNTVFASENPAGTIIELKK